MIIQNRERFFGSIKRSQLRCETYNVKEPRLKEFAKKGLKILNYKNENSVPRDRLCGEAFCRENGCGGTRRRSEWNACRECRERRERRETAPETVRCRESACERGGRVCPQRCTRVRAGKCGEDNGFLHREAPLGMVYSPVQLWRELYDPKTALTQGTLFRELNLEFYPTPCNKKECSTCR